MSDKYGVSQDPDCYPNSSVLVNKLNIRDAQELEAVEAELTQLRSESFEPDFAAFDLGALAAIHRHLFQDIYPWAGQLRTVDISKGNTRFCSAQYIQKEADRLLARLQSEQWLEGLALPEFVAKIADYYCELNVIHPFREGNGRTQRLFFEAIALNAGYEVDWSQVNRDEWLDANIRGYFADLAPLQAIFVRIVSSL